MRAIPPLLLTAALCLTPHAASAAACVPGAQVACACGGGGSGVQVCAEDGSKLGPCDCAEAAPSPDAPPASTATPPPRGSAHAKRGRGLLIGGIVTLGVGYLFGVFATIAGAAVDASEHARYGVDCVRTPGFSMLPLVGTAIVAARYPSYSKITTGGLLACGDGAAGVTAFATVDTILQVGGAGMLGAGIALDMLGRPQETASPPPRVVVLPGVAGSPSGLTVVVPWQ